MRQRDYLATLDPRRPRWAMRDADVAWILAWIDHDQGRVILWCQPL
jgi:hypothetical protein